MGPVAVVAWLMGIALSIVDNVHLLPDT